MQLNCYFNSDTVVFKVWTWEWSEPICFYLDFKDCLISSIDMSVYLFEASPLWSGVFYLFLVWLAAIGVVGLTKFWGF